jgi:hypothetical protein
MRGHEGARDSRRLAERAHVHDPVRLEAEMGSVPRPPQSPSPSTPKPCASSTTSHASNSSASASMAGNGAMSPSMLKTASVAITFRFAFDAARRRAPAPLRRHADNG